MGFPILRIYIDGNEAFDRIRKLIGVQICHGPLSNDTGRCASALTFSVLKTFKQWVLRLFRGYDQKSSLFEPALVGLGMMSVERRRVGPGRCPKATFSPRLRDRGVFQGRGRFFLAWHSSYCIDISAQWAATLHPGRPKKSNNRSRFLYRFPITKQ